MTQSELAYPMTRSFVSAVEHGKTLPSLAALLLISARLDVSPGELLEQTEWTVNDIYTEIYHGDDQPDDHAQDPASGGGG